jgi:hypothetical protein
MRNNQVGKRPRELLGPSIANVVTVSHNLVYGKGCCRRDEVDCSRVNNLLHSSSPHASHIGPEVT